VWERVVREDAERWARQLVWIDTPKELAAYIADDLKLALGSRKHQQRIHRANLKRLRKALAALGLHPGMTYEQMKAAVH
jgi:hypothetical protein